MVVGMFELPQFLNILSIQKLTDKLEIELCGTQCFKSIEMINKDAKTSDMLISKII